MQGRQREKDYSCRGSLSRPQYFNLPSAIPKWTLPPTATVLLCCSHNPSPRCVLLHVHAFKFSSSSFDLVFHASYYTDLLMESADLSMCVMLQPKWESAYISKHHVPLMCTPILPPPKLESSTTRHLVAAYFTCRAPKLESTIPGRSRWAPQGILNSRWRS